jgi:hypothetical protein
VIWDSLIVNIRILPVPHALHRKATRYHERRFDGPGSSFNAHRQYIHHKKTMVVSGWHHTKEISMPRHAIFAVLAALPLKRSSGTWNAGATSRAACT